ncbi:MAG: ribosome small subunit-dependent GTPase A [Planctomycetia bacterium]|nr:ribosome small subunit-dependent GTPase A [Planctomycetia bacterium]
MSGRPPRPRDVPAGTDAGLATVVRQDAKGVVVRLDAAPEGVPLELWCSVRGRVHLGGSVSATTTIAVGDRVRVHRVADDRGAVEEVLPRRSVLSRPEPDQGRRRSRLLQQVLAANVDRVVVVASAADPAFDPGLVDRVLVVAEWSRLDALVVVNKLDLVAAEPPEAAVYRRMGYRVVGTSATTGVGIDELRAALIGAVSVITGHSGVGKSSLLNAVEPGLGLAVGRLNEVTGRGRQTTTSALLVPLAGGGALVDTPGIREFGLYNVPPREVTWLFRDLREVAPRCKFGDCLHRDEPGCAVAAAVATGELAAWRVDSYHRMLATMPDVPRWGIPGGR